jgi:syntaxin 1B/2/3
MINRLPELQSSLDCQDDAGNVYTSKPIITHTRDSDDSIDSSDLSRQMTSDTVITLQNTNAIFSPIEKIIQKVRNATLRIDQLYNVKRTGLPDQQRSAQKEVDYIVLNTTPEIRRIKDLLSNAQKQHQASLQSIQSRKLKETEHTWFNNMYNSFVRKYQACIIHFQASATNFKNLVRDDFTRQARIVDPHISTIQVQKMLESPDPAQYLQTHIMSISPELLDEVRELEQEHERVRKLEKTIAEIQELFNACAVLIAQSQEQLNEIEKNVENTKIQVEVARQEIRKAEYYTKQTRKTKVQILLCLFLIILIISCIVFGPVLKVLPGF